MFSFDVENIKSAQAFRCYSCAYFLKYAVVFLLKFDLDRRNRAIIFRTDIDRPISLAKLTSRYLGNTKNESDISGVRNEFLSFKQFRDRLF